MTLEATRVDTMCRWSTVRMGPRLLRYGDRKGASRRVPEQWLGIVVSGTSVACVHLDCGHDPAKLINQFTWQLQDGDRVDSYHNICERLSNYVRNNDISNVAIKASAAGQAGTSLAHLHSAELRGVICVSARMGGACVRPVQKALISRTFGSRKADEHIADDIYWDGVITGDVAKTRREAALLVLSQREAP